MSEYKVIPINNVVIQNVDRAIINKDYVQFGDNLLVTSFFRTIQGEGPFAGYPSIFLRLAGCNYGEKDFFCKFCDTAFQFDEGLQYSVETLLSKLTDLEDYSPNDILVITGGEPTLQLNLLKLIKAAAPYFKDIQIETNGTQPSFFKAVEELGISNLFKTVVSPKANYKAGRYAVVHPTVRWYATCFKFVLDADPNSPHHVVPEWALDRTLMSCPVYVSPMAAYLKPYQGEVSSIWEDGLINKEVTSANYTYAAKYAMKHNLLLSLQTHLFVGLA